LNACLVSLGEGEFECVFCVQVVEELEELRSTTLSCDAKFATALDTTFYNNLFTQPQLSCVGTTIS